MTMEFLWNSSRISIRILVANLCIQQFRWLSNSSRIKWLRNSCEILPGFDRNSSRTTWPWNSYEILQGFWSEYWLSGIVSNNSLRIRLPQNSWQILSGFIIIIKWNNFDENLRIRWPLNSYIRFQGFWSEFWWVPLCNHFLTLILSFWLQISSYFILFPRGPRALIFWS